jgi:hypothetical protein
MMSRPWVAHTECVAAERVIGATMADPKFSGTLIKAADPKKGTSYEEYVAICKALGVAPAPPSPPAPAS